MMVAHTHCELEPEKGATLEVTGDEKQMLLAIEEREKIYIEKSTSPTALAPDNKYKELHA